MDLELSEEQRELKDGVRRVLEAHCPPAVPRAVHERGGALWQQAATPIQMDFSC